MYPLLIPSTAASLVQATVIVHRDYCDSLLTNLSSSPFAPPLQSIFKDSMAGAILSILKPDHATSLLTSLHWVPI